MRHRLALAALLIATLGGPAAAAPAPTKPAPSVTPLRGDGWIRVAPNGRYLQHANGAPFFAVGHGEAFGFFFQKMNPKETIRALFKDMQARGQNTLIVQAENEDLNFYGGHRLNLEHPLGTYHEDIAKQFDELLDLAAAHDIQVITYLWDTFHMDWRWEQSPWNQKNGGPLTYVGEFFTHPEARRLAKAKLAWAIDRWGNRKNLLAWDLLNEIDTVYGFVDGNKRPDGTFHTVDGEAVKDWVTDMARFTRETELKRWGKTHLRTVSTTNPHFERNWFYEHPDIDLITNHQYYHGPGSTRDPKSPEAVALAVQEGCRYVLERTRYRKPYFDTESGPIDFDFEHPGKLRRRDAFRGPFARSLSPAFGEAIAVVVRPARGPALAGTNR